jgi:hypothetical protein
VPEGSFKMDCSNLFEHYSFLCDFVATKPWAAAIVKEVEAVAIAVGLQTGTDRVQSTTSPKYQSDHQSQSTPSLVD